MSDNQWILLGAAVFGVVSVAVMYISEKIQQNKKKQSYSRDIARLEEQLKNLQEELKTFRSLQLEKHNFSSSRKSRRSFTTSSRTSNDDYSSAVDGDSSDLEFYDLSSDEDTYNIEESLQKEFEELDKILEGESDYKEALNKLEDLNKKYANNAEIMWRLGKALKIKISFTTNPSERQELIDRGISICDAAVHLKPNSAFCHKWKAILVGLRGEFQPTKERIMDGYIFSEHIKKAMQITPEDPELYHLLGRFTFEVAKLSWFEKTVASALFAEPPNGTYQEALNQFLTAEKLSKKEWKENRLFIAKCELAIGKTDSAVEWLSKADIASNDEEEKVHEEVKSLLQKYKKD